MEAGKSTQVKAAASITTVSARPTKIHADRYSSTAKLCCHRKTAIRVTSRCSHHWLALGCHTEMTNNEIIEYIGRSEQGTKHD